MRFVPNFKGNDFFPHDTHFDFMRFRSICFWASITAMVASLGLFIVLGLNYGVDFKGGTLIEIQSKSGRADVGDLRAKIGALGLGSPQIQEFGATNDVLIRIEEQPGGDAGQQQALRKVIDAIGDGYVQRRVEVVGPAVSSELRRTGLIAVVCCGSGDHCLRVVPVRVAVRRWRGAGADPRCPRHRWRLFAVPARIRSLHRRGAADHSRLFRQRYGGHLRPHPGELAQVQAHGCRGASQSVDQRDAVAHDPDELPRPS